MNKGTKNIAEILATRNDRGYQIQTYLDDLKVILLGERHYMPDMHQKQKELIEIIQPEIVLHEFLTGRIYNPQKKKFEFQASRKRTDFDKDTEIIEISETILRAAQKTGSKIIGCDLTMAEINEAMKEVARKNPKKYKYDEGLDHIFNIQDEDDCLTSLSDEIIPFRDKKMVEEIIKYVKQTNKPLIVIAGQLHTENIHRQGAIQGKGFGYAYVDQITEKGNN